jgi:hypothetical protein
MNRLDVPNYFKISTRFAFVKFLYVLPLMLYELFIF